MYIRRKVFSRINVEGEERLFSVNETELQERISLFSEKSNKEEEPEKKMKTLDKISLWQYKHLYGKHGKKAERDRINFAQDEETTKRVFKRAGIGSAVATGLGTGVGAIVGGKEGAKCGAVLGGAAGAGILAGNAAGYAVKKAALKNEKYKKGWDKQSDLLDVAEGKLSEEEFIKRWGKPAKKAKK